jgi:hypothetical protein
MTIKIYGKFVKIITYALKNSVFIDKPVECKSRIFFQRKSF